MLGSGRILAIAFCAWFALWAAVGLRVVGTGFPWKSVSTAAILVLVVTAGSYALSRQESVVRMAVVIPADTTLRTGDGPSFPAVSQSPLSEGRAVELLKERGDWLQIKTDNGQIGWLPKNAVEII